MDRLDAAATDSLLHSFETLVKSKEAVMRHTTGRVDVTGIKAVSGSKTTSGANESVNAKPQSNSLRSHLPKAKYVACDDIVFTALVEEIETAGAGDLVIYRIGEQCPSRFSADALALGVAGIVTEQILPTPLPQCIVGDVDLAMAEFTASQLDRPDRKVLTIGVVGSAGKTTTALMIAAILRRANVRTAYQTDLGECDGIVQSTPESTLPTAAPLIRWLGEAVDSECGAAVIELSDQALTYGHYDAIEFDLLIVTGPASTSSHFGPSALACALDRLASDGVVITPADDPRIMHVVRDCGVRMVTYGIQRAADVTAKTIDQCGNISTLLLTYDDTTTAMETPLCGGAMAACHCAAATVGMLINQSLTTVAETLGNIRQLPGRMQCIATIGQPTIYLDVAGSSKRLTTALRTARAMRKGKLWCVLSLTGSESTAELAEYGRLAERFAGQVVLTCHPDAKSEFLQLAHAVLDGVKQCAAFRWVANCKQAIEFAMLQAKSSDTILIAGGIRHDSPQQQRSQLKKVETWIHTAIEQRPQASIANAVPASKPTLKLFS